MESSTTSEECGGTLRVVDDDEDVRHLGFWAPPNGDWKDMVDRVHASTLEVINIVKHSVKVACRQSVRGSKPDQLLDCIGFSLLSDTHPMGPT
jgi:hypothetical protein